MGTLLGFIGHFGVFDVLLKLLLKGFLEELSTLDEEESFDIVGEYPLVYKTVLVHRKEPGEKVERFVQWLLSEEGQRLVRSVGYVPIREL